MLAAEELDMVKSGEYVFFNIELYSRLVDDLSEQQLSIFASDDDNVDFN